MGQQKFPATGRWRLLFPALLIWGICAYAIGNPGAAMLIFFLSCAGSTALLAAVIFTRKNYISNKKMRQILSMSAILLALITLLAARTDYLETDRKLSVTALGLKPPPGTQQVFLNVETRVTDFAVQTSNKRQESYALKSVLKGKKSSVPVILWITDSAAKDFAPGTNLLITGFAKEQAPAANFALEIAVFEFQINKQSNSYVAKLRNNLHGAASDIEGASLVPGFAVGDTSLVNEDLEQKMKASSLTHLTAVSGANCALITSFMIAIAARLGAGRKLRIIIAVLSLLGFLAVVGPDPSVQRAAIMAGVALLSGFGGKKSVAYSSLGAAIILLLFLDPWQARTPGFTLSVAATAGILLFVPVVSKHLQSVLKLPVLITLPLTVSIATQISCAPLLLLLQDGLPMAGIPANLLAAPAAPIGTALGLIALLTLPFSYSVGQFFVYLASFASRWVEATAEVTSALPFGRWFWPGGALGATLLAAIEALLIIAYIFWQHKKPARLPWQKRKQASKVTVLFTTILSVLAISVFVSVSFVTPAVQQLSFPKNWTLVGCDVGQGDATLMRSANKKVTILVDTGDDENLLRSCLKQFGVKSIDLLVLTHDDKDHIGAAGVILDKTKHALIAPDLLGVDHDNRTIIQKLKRAQVPYQVAGAGTHLRWEEADLELKVIWPDLQRKYVTDNSASIVLNVAVSEYRYLLLGDTGMVEHQKILQDESAVKSDVVKVAHHGSGDFLPELLLASSARIGVISAGAQNSYGHPHSEVLKTLNDNHIYVLRTDEQGSVAIFEKGERLQVWAGK